MSHRSEVEVLEDVKGLHQDGALGPGSLSVDFVSVEADLDGRLVFCLVVGERVHVEDASDTFAAVGDDLRHFAGVETVTSGANTIRSFTLGGKLCVYELPESGGDSFLDEQ